LRKPIEFEMHPIPHVQAVAMGMLRGVCKYVTDGDTYDVYISLGLDQYAYMTIRLHDFDTAEIFHPSNAAERAHGMAAKARVTDLILNKPVLLRTFRDAETFGRYVADVAVVTSNPLTLTDVAEVLESEGYAKKASYA
jgi:endonuclease YncB( thermonuclease family)